MKLSGRNAIITGGSQGLGRAIAEHFLGEGADVVLCARSEADLNATQADLTARYPGRTILVQACDVSDETQIRALIEFSLQALGSVHILVCNAGVFGPMGPTDEADLAEWRRAIEI